MKGNWVKNNLGFASELYVYQDKTMFNYSVDTIMLGNFATVNRNTKKVLEIGTNNAALSIFYTERYHKMKVDAIEIQENAIELAKCNVELNNKEDSIKIINEDFNTYYKKKLDDKYDAIICNPPFYKVDSYIKRKGSEELYIATHEVKITLEDIIAKSSKILKRKGYLSLVIPVERMIDCVTHMRNNKIEPKRIQFIFPRTSSKPNLVLIEGRFETGWGVHFLPNLYLHPDELNNKEYRDEIKKLYTPIKYEDSISKEKYE